MINEIMRTKVSLGIDIGGTNIAYGVIDREGECVLIDSKPIKSFDTPQALIAALRQDIERRLDTRKFQLIGVGTGAPSGNYFAGTIENTANLNWEGRVPFVELTEKEFGLPAFITNDAKASASIRGFLIQTRLDGLWRAINCPVIGRYCDHFALAGPAWGDCSFTVGFDLARDLLDLRLDLVSTEGGTYRGIPFDEAQTTIRCRSIWDTVAEIGPVVIRRGGKVAATADLRLDYPADRLFFRARATGLTPAECLGIIDGELAADLPSILCTDFPSVTVAGHIPLSGDETLPSQVVLEGEASAPGGALIEGLPTASASARFAMTNGVFALRDVALTLPHGGAVSGALAFDIPDRAPHAELSAALRLREASLADLLTPLGSETLTNCFATGFVDLRGRLGPDFPSTLQAEYDLTVDGGLIRRLPLFAGLTDLLAEHVPGVSAVTDSSTARLVGTADHGIFAIPDFSLDGDLLAIEGPATYDLPNDALSAEVIAGNFRRGTLMGTLTRWVTVPVNRFLWRVKVAGPLSAPTWSLSTVLGRWWEKALGGDSAPPDGE